MMREITSGKNPAVQAAKALLTPKGRREREAFLCDGEHMVEEALKACPERVTALFVDNARQESFQALVSQAPASAQVYLAPEGVMQSISQVKTSQGVAAVCGLPARTSLGDLRGRLVLLENVQDPGNVGGILRTMDAAGFSGCVLTRGCADPYSPKALRASMGSLFRVALAFAEDGPAAARELKARGYGLLGAELGGAPFYERERLPEQVCLLIGNEGAGLTPEIVKECAWTYRLPMRGGAESLNAGVAAAVMMYDLVNRE